MAASSHSLQNGPVRVGRQIVLCSPPQQPEVDVEQEAVSSSREQFVRASGQLRTSVELAERRKKPRETGSAASVRPGTVQLTPIQQRWHLVRSLPPSAMPSKKPVLHAQSAELFAPTRVAAEFSMPAPTSQLVGCLEPSGQNPSAHSTQLVWPRSSWYVPAGQGLQDSWPEPLTNVPGLQGTGSVAPGRQ